MANKNSKTVYLVQSAVIAALYTALTYLVSPLSYGVTQFRFSEALTILPVFTPAAIPGLTIGCLISNIGSPFGLADLFFGTFATLISAILTRISRNILFKKIPIVSPVFPVILNGFFVGIEFCFFVEKSATFSLFFATFLSVALGELVVCYLLGIPLYFGIKKIGILKGGE